MCTVSLFSSRPQTLLAERAFGTFPSRKQFESVARGDHFLRTSCSYNCNVHIWAESSIMSGKGISRSCWNMVSEVPCILRRYCRRCARRDRGYTQEKNNLLPVSLHTSETLNTSLILWKSQRFSAHWWVRKNIRDLLCLQHQLCNE